jgi:leucyl aminopeptidase
MKIFTEARSGKSDCHIQFAFEEEKFPHERGFEPLVKKAISDGEFSGKDGQTALLHGASSRLLLVGLGKEKDFSIDSIRVASARAAVYARDSGMKKIAFLSDGACIKKAGGISAYAAAITEGAILSLYRFSKKTGEAAEEAKKKEIEEITVVVNESEKGEVGKAAAVAEIISNSNSFARDIANEAGKEATPTAITLRVSEMAKQYGIKCTVLSEEECKKEKMGAFLSVAAGSRQPPKFIILEYKPSDAKDTICFVGKGITFDTGGISLKPSKEMDKMKHDKCGAAAVYGALMAAAALKLPYHVIGITPLTENMPGGNATKPGDIVTAASGKTIEILNTDAEGRLVLADALNYANKFKPSAIIDLATLTGACVVALGSHATGLATNNPELAAKVKAAGEAVHERVWELPLWKEYYEMIKGDFADIKNIGSPDGEAGTLTAAAFLGNFVGETPWVHLDIAGTAYFYKPRLYYYQVGATGVGVRLLTKMLMDWKKK